MTTAMTWDGFVSAWAGAHDGYDPRYAGRLERHWMRGAYRIGVPLARARVSPGTPRTLAVACAIAVPVLAAAQDGWPWLAALALGAGLALDSLAQTVAVLRGMAGRLDGFYRSLLERFTEVCWLVAIALLGAAPLLVILCATAVWAHEYIRARAGSVGLRSAAAATIGDRPTRVWIVVVALVLAAITAQVRQELAAGVVTMVLVVWLSLSVIGLGQLLTIVRKSLGR